MTRKHRTFTTEFKLESASLVLDQDCTISEAYQTTGTGKPTLIANSMLIYRTSYSVAILLISGQERAGATCLQSWIGMAVES